MKMKETADEHNLHKCSNCVVKYKEALLGKRTGRLFDYADAFT